MIKPSIPGERFFARIRAVDFACPRCDFVFCIRPKTKRTAYDPKTGIFRCPECELVLALGVVAYGLRLPRANALRRRVDPRGFIYKRTARTPLPTLLKNNRTPPEDWNPTTRQALAIRDFVNSGIWTDLKRSVKDGPRAAQLPRNVYLSETCTCDLTQDPPLQPDVNCGVHGRRAQGRAHDPEEFGTRPLPQPTPGRPQR